MIAERINDIINKNRDSIAFVIDGERYTYADLSKRIAAIRTFFTGKLDIGDRLGVVAANKLDVYASFFACLFSGWVFVPLSPQLSEERHRMVLQSAGIKWLLVADKTYNASQLSVQVVNTEQLPVTNEPVSLVNLSPDALAYILFTSGSTGVPKGVPISHSNLTSFVDAFLELNLGLNSEDRFLQLYDLTFDASVQTYVIPICLGASVYTVGQNQFKFLQAVKLMRDEQLTVIKMVPSTLHALKPYFKQLSLPSVKLCLFGGEALNQQLVSEWAACIPNAQIHNVYGPTEATVNCMYFNWIRGVYDFETVPIGKPYGKTQVAVLSDKDEIQSVRQKGELCLSGPQVFSGYWNSTNKNIFVTIDGQTYYRTGDLVVELSDGNFQFCGRTDYQVKISGYRIELEEIEAVAMTLTGNRCVAKVNDPDTQKPELVLFVETNSIDEEAVKVSLQKHLPHYMIPARVYAIPCFPQSVSGKIDRKLLIIS